MSDSLEVREGWRRYRRARDRATASMTAFVCGAMTDVDDVYQDLETAFMWRLVMEGVRFTGQTNAFLMESTNDPAPEEGREG